MRTLRTLLLVLVTLGAAQIASAQAATLAWTAPIEVVTALEGQTLIYTLYVNGAAAGSNVTAVVCVGPSPTVTCSAPLPPATPSAIGTKIELTARAGTSAESPRSVGFISAPSAPTNFRKQ